jgi:hypothetical protein
VQNATKRIPKNRASRRRRKHGSICPKQNVIEPVAKRKPRNGQINENRTCACASVRGLITDNLIGQFLSLSMIGICVSDFFAAAVLRAFLKLLIGIEEN